MYRDAVDEFAVSLNRLEDFAEGRLSRDEIRYRLTDVINLHLKSVRSALLKPKYLRQATLDDFLDRPEILSIKKLARDSRAAYNDTFRIMALYAKSYLFFSDPDSKPDRLSKVKDKLGLRDGDIGRVLLQ